MRACLASRSRASRVRTLALFPEWRGVKLVAAVGRSLRRVLIDIRREKLDIVLLVCNKPRNSTQSVGELLRLLLFVVARKAARRPVRTLLAINRSDQAWS